MYRWVSPRLLAALVTLAVMLAGFVVLLIVQDHREAAAADQAQSSAAARARATWEADLARAAEVQAERDRIAAENAAAREAAEKELAVQRAAEEKAAREAAAKLAAERARAAAEQARQLAEQKRLEEEMKERHTVRGTVLVPDSRGALLLTVGARPGQTLADLTEEQRSQFYALRQRLQGGATFGCRPGVGGRWSDVIAGALVSIEGGDGTLLAAGALTGGTLTADGCRFTFAVEAGYAESYRVRITQRKPATWTRETLEDRGWRVAITL